MQEQNSSKLKFNSKNKNSFFFGLITGVAVIAVIGFFVMMGLYMNQTSNTDINSAAENDDQQPTAQDVELKPISDNDWIRGDRNAKISIIEFSDTECPFCKKHHPTLQRVVKEYDGKVNWVYRHFPLISIHPKAVKEAEAIECAGELAGNDGFWKYVDRLFEITPGNNQLEVSQLFEIAKYVGLNNSEFETCLNSGKYTIKVQDQYNQAVSAGGRGTPFNIIVVGEQMIPMSGAVPFEQLKTILDELLK